MGYLFNVSLVYPIYFRETVHGEQCENDLEHSSVNHWQNSIKVMGSECLWWATKDAMSKELRRELHHPKAAKVVAKPPQWEENNPPLIPTLTLLRHGVAQKVLFAFKILKQLLPTRIISSSKVDFWEFISDKNMK